MALPAMSVNMISVLLNVARMCTTPIGMFFLTFFFWPDLGFAIRVFLTYFFLTLPRRGPLRVRAFV